MPLHGRRVTWLPSALWRKNTLRRSTFGDTAETTPLLMMYTLGHTFMPPSIHSGGLRYHGMAPTVSHLHKLGLIESAAVPQTKIFESALLFARTEGIIPAPETAHAIHTTIQEAIKAREEGRKRVIVFCFSGHGMIDLAAYDAYLDGTVKNS